MNQQYLDELQRLIADIPTGASPEASAEKLGMFVGPITSFETRLGSCFAGVSSRDHLASLAFLAHSLRLLGCVLIGRESKALERDKFPGSVWLTVLATPVLANVLIAVAKRTQGVTLEQLPRGLLVVVGASSSAVMAFSAGIQENAMQRRSEKQVKP